MLEFEWKYIEDISPDAIEQFSCGSGDFDLFLKNDAKKWNTCGEGVTIVAVLPNTEDSESINEICAYATISSTGLLKADGSRLYESCVEIRLFAVNKKLQGPEAVDTDGERFSYKLFQSLMQHLYWVSTHIIGFKLITLNSNSRGLNLYRRFGFIETKGFIVSEDNKIDLAKCTPMLFKVIGNEYQLFT